MLLLVKMRYGYTNTMMMKETEFLTITINAMKVILAGLAVASIGSFIYLIGANIFYPMQFTHVEGNILHTVWRIRQGLPIYTAPSLEYIANLYMPFYYYVAAGLSYLTGVSYFTLRLVSLLSLVGMAAIVVLWARREKLSTLEILICLGVICATCKYYYIWYDLGRADLLCIFLLLWSVYLVCYNPSGRAALAAGILFALSILTKQTSAIVIGPLMAAAFFTQHRNYFFLLTVSFAATLLPTMAAFAYFTDGWFWYFVYEMPKNHGFARLHIWNFWTNLFPRAWYLILCSILSCAFLFRHSRGKAFMITVFIVTMVLMTYAMRLHIGGAMNTLMPAYFALSIGFILGVNHWRHYRRAYAFFLFISCVYAAQLWYHPGDYAPKKQNYADAEKYIDALKKIEGDILILNNIYFLPYGENQRVFNLSAGLWDITRSRHRSLRKTLREEYKQAFQQKKFSAIISTSEGLRRENVLLWSKSLGLRRMITKNYRYEKTIWPATSEGKEFLRNKLQRPRHVHVPK